MNLAFVSPRLHEPGTVGGAETLIYSLAQDAVLPEGSFERDGMTVRRFPADPLKVDSFARLQIDLSRGRRLSDAEEAEWLRSGVNSSALVAWLREHAADYDRVVAGPYLFALIREACLAVPEKMLLVPCFHDENYARIRALQAAFRGVRGFLFNTEPERRLAHRLMPGLAPRVEASSRSRRTRAPSPPAPGLRSPTWSTAAGARRGRGRRSLSTSSTASAAARSATSIS